jgi:hypothetical protein
VVGGHGCEVEAAVRTEAGAWLEHGWSIAEPAVTKAKQVLLPSL